MSSLRCLVCLLLAFHVACGTANGDDSTEPGDMNDISTDASIVEVDGGSAESDSTVVTETPENLPPSTACDVIEENWPAQWSEYEQAVVDLVNERRAVSQDCGSEGQFAPVPPVSANTQLACAARRHSLDMAQRGYFSHVDPDGVAPDTRILATGYQPRAMGENIAAGAATPLMVVNGWMESDGHCRNIMDATFTELGVGYIVDETTQYRRYWTQAFGAR